MTTDGLFKKPEPTETFHIELSEPQVSPILQESQTSSLDFGVPAYFVSFKTVVP